MNLRGSVENGFARFELSLVGKNGQPISISFVVDTAFDGYLAIAHDLLIDAETFAPTVSRIRPVNAPPRDCESVSAFLSAEAAEVPRVVEVLVLEDGSLPLLGIEFMWDHLLSVEFARQGDVTLEET